jgi:hypothetical protein
MTMQDASHDAATIDAFPAVLDVRIDCHNDCTLIAHPPSINVSAGTGFEVNWINVGDTVCDVAKIDQFNQVPIIIGLEPGTSYHDPVHTWCGAIFTGTFEFRIDICTLPSRPWSTAAPEAQMDQPQSKRSSTGTCDGSRVAVCLVVANARADAGTAPRSRSDGGASLQGGPLFEPHDDGALRQLVGLYQRYRTVAKLQASIAQLDTGEDWATLRAVARRGRRVRVDGARRALAANQTTRSGGFAAGALRHRAAPHATRSAAEVQSPRRARSARR